MVMDKKVKLLIYFLNYLSQKSKFKKISLEKYREIATLLGHKDFLRNESLFDFYNQNVEDNVNWENFNLTPYVNSFIAKIESVFYRKESPKNLFSDPIDNYFYLEYNYNKPYIDFNDDSIHIAFTDSYNSFLLDLVNLDDNDFSYYAGAKYNGNCYTPDYSNEEMVYIFGSMGSDCINKVKEIITIFGDIELASNLDRVPNINEDQAEKIIKLFKFHTDDIYLDKLFDEYQSAVNRASCNSIIEAYESHFNDDVKMYDNRTIEVKYEFFINFLKENPSIKTFSDLQNYKLIDDYDHISDAIYEYDLDYEYLNREYYTILDDMYDNVTSDDDIIERIEQTKKLFEILKSLKFESKEKGYYKDIRIGSTFSRFVIPYNGIDTIKKTVTLTIFKGEANREMGNKTYKIPFDEIADYVTIEKLHEMIKMKIRKYLL